VSLFLALISIGDGNSRSFYYFQEMTLSAVHQRIRNSIVSKFKNKFPVSGRLHEEARQFLPGGNTKQIAYHRPYPVVVAGAKGVVLQTEDGSELIDFCSAYGTIVMGHAHPIIEAAAINEMKNGMMFGTPARIQWQFAEALTKRIPSMQKIRLATTGTEAVTFALQAARHYTRKPKVVVFHGGYHGTCLFATEQPQSGATIGTFGGATHGKAEEVIVLEWNDHKALEDTLRSHGHDIACVLMEPFLGAGGVIRASTMFLETVQRETEANGVLWVLDEITSIRCAYSGMQSKIVRETGNPRTPDITLVGKLISGGFPLAAVGGPDEIMKVFDCYQTPAEGLVRNSGSFIGHSVACATGLAAMQVCTKEVVRTIKRNGEFLSKQLRAYNKSIGLNIQIHNIGPLLNIHFATEPITNTAEKNLHSASDLTELMHLELCNAGYFCLPRLMIFVSAAHNEAHLEGFINAYEQSITTLLPILQERQGFLKKASAVVH
jgi:glutamate-1-semialdehyde 2,1-aminomutase